MNETWRMKDGALRYDLPGGDDARGLLASLDILNQHALRWMFSSAEASSSFPTQDFVCRQDVSKFSDSPQEFYGKVVAAPSAWACMRGCMCICCGGCSMHETGVVEHPCMCCKYVCSQVVCYTGVLNASVQFAKKCRRHQYTYLQIHSLQGGHMRSCMHSLFSLSLGNEGGRVELVYAGHLFAGVDGYL